MPQKLRNDNSIAAKRQPKIRPTVPFIAKVKLPPWQSSLTQPDRTIFFIIDQTDNLPIMRFFPAKWGGGVSTIGSH